MKKVMRKILALAVAMLLVLGTFSAFAADGTTPAADTSISISNLDTGDTVNLYKVIEWDTVNTGWKLAAGFTGLSNNTNIKKLIDNDATFAGLTQTDLEAIATAAKTAAKISSEATTAETYSKDVVPGMYLALIAPKKADTIYNPIIVSADYNAGGNTISALSTMGSNGIAKKETVTLTKDTADYTLDSGEIVKFTVTTTIPAYAANYINPTFVMKDSLSTGLKFVVDNTHPFTVSSGDVTYTGAPETDDTSFTLNFDSAKISALVAPQSVKVEYYAKLTNAAPYTVNEETNDVTVEFSNNPEDADSHGHLKDEVKEYTFTIDGALFGNSDWTTSELVKVGLDKDGNPVEEVIKQDNGHECAALDGAVFGLYTDKDEADNSSTNYYTNAVFNGTVTTANGGLMEIKGLDEGTYYLKELSAPAGYIKDDKTHTIEITAIPKTVSKTETLTDSCVVTYDVKVLDKYTVTIDGKTTSTYTMTLDGPTITKSSKTDQSTDIVNTKGVELPSTGGMGTTIFYVIGGLLVLAAAIVLISKRRVQQ